MSNIDKAMETKRDFIIAAASYFGIDPDQVLLDSEVKSNDKCIILSLEIAVTQSDLIGIAQRMEQLAKAPADLDFTLMDKHLQEPPAQPITLEEVARNEQAFKDDESAEPQRRIILQLRGEYDQATHAERNGRSRWQYVVDRAREMDEQAAQGAYHTAVEEHLNNQRPFAPDPRDFGINGREVKHVDTPEEEVTGSPLESVWLTDDKASAEQIRFSSNGRVINGVMHYAINVQMLTPEQRAELGLA
jgi:hypothetical protein